MEPTKKLLTDDQVADYLQLCTRTIRSLLAESWVLNVSPPCVKVGRQRRWWPEGIDAWIVELDARKTGAARARARQILGLPAPVAAPPVTARAEERTETLYQATQRRRREREAAQGKDSGRRRGR